MHGFVGSNTVSWGYMVNGLVDDFTLCDSVRGHLMAFLCLKAFLEALIECVCHIPKHKAIAEVWQ